LNQALPAKTISLTPFDNARLSVLCGERHSHLKIIESEFLVRCSQHGAEFVIQGAPEKIELAARALTQLYQQTQHNSALAKPHIYQVINNMADPALRDVNAKDTEFERVQAPLKAVTARNKSQSKYLEAIKKHDVVFGIGPAGTGKTYLAVAAAVQALVNEEVNRIVLVRPIVEAGEHLGFLPGDIGQKIDPYLRPLYDALYDLLGYERVSKLIERNAIELAPLAYMRGRTLSDAFVIMDEAQNTTMAQMKMLLTRIGFGSKVVLTGDISQVDLPKGTFSGLKHALTILENVRGIATCKFTGKDIVRHQLVQRIVDAYDKNN